MNRVGLSLVAFLIVFGVGVTQRVNAPPDVAQPIRYNHRIHIENDLACSDCHRGAEEGQRATIPPLEVCADCHDEATGAGVEEEKVVTSVVESRPILWRRIDVMPEHVYFSHRRHTTVGQIECETCHGDIASLEAPPRRALLVPSMDDCLECHEDRDASTDCNACHR